MLRPIVTIATISRLNEFMLPSVLRNLQARGGRSICFAVIILMDSSVAQVTLQEIPSGQVTRIRLKNREKLSLVFQTYLAVR